MTTPDIHIHESPHTFEEASTHARTLGDMIVRAAEKHHGPALRWKEGERWVDLSFGEVGKIAREIAAGLIALDIEPGDRVAILSNTRPEWTLADFGALCAGATLAPIYHTNSPEECRYVLQHSDARVVFCEDEEQLEKVRQVRTECPALQYVVLFEGEADDAITLDKLRELGQGVEPGAVDARIEASSPDDVATLVYTSGTTGPPKGCMLTHRNFMYTMEAYDRQLDLGVDPEGLVIFFFLPLAHSLARVTQMVTLDVGGTLAYWQRDPKKLLDDLKEAKPSHFPSVPRVFEKIYTAATSGIAEQRAPKRAFVNWALATGRRVRDLERAGRRPGPVLRGAHRVADHAVLSKVRALFGGELQLALTGAAPIASDVLEFFDSCGVLVLEGYGMTESCAACSVNTPRQFRFGTVGPPLPGSEVRIAEDGEILMAGPHVFAGYFKNDDATRETVEDGWLRTGDLGVLEDGFVSVTGRKKDLIITSSGKNITPTNIEERLKENRWISEAVVYGDNRPYLVAIVTLDPDELPKLAEHLGIAADAAQMASDERVRAEIQKAVDQVNKSFARIEQIKRFAILDHDLSQASGELTPTMKVKRRVVYDRYSALFDSLYE